MQRKKRGVAIPVSRSGRALLDSGAAGASPKQVLHQFAADMADPSVVKFERRR